MTYTRACLFASTAAVFWTVGVPGAAAAQTRQFDVQTQPARTGIPMFAHQAGIQILVTSPLTEGVSVNGVRGTMDVAQGLRTLLAGTDLAPMQTPGGIVLQRRSARPRLANASSVAVAPQAAAATPVVQGAEPVAPAGSTDASDPEIVVTGIRASLQESIQVKPTADNIVDAITAQDIGKLPDQNVADSMSRITGVQITRREGDGSSFTVRGISQNRLEINGRTFLGPGAGGNASLESVSPEIISRWPDLSSPTTRKRGESYSIFVPSSELSNLRPFLATGMEGGAVEIGGKKWSASIRMPFPHEELWMAPNDEIAVEEKAVSREHSR